MRIRQNKAFALIETLYRQDGNIDEYSVLYAGPIFSWDGLRELINKQAQMYARNSQYEVIWDEEPGAYHFAVRDKRLDYVFADVEILLPDLVTEN